MTSHKPILCSGREETIHLFLDGELNPNEREIFLSHLQTCPACQALLGELSGLFTELTALPEVAAPSELVSQVMARLPAPHTSARWVTLGQLALIGQVVIGVALLLVFAPLIAASLDSALLWQPWFSLSEMGLSLLSWFRELLTSLIDLAQTQWPPPSPWPVFNFSPLWLGGIVAGLVLAWLIGNGLLLHRYPTSFKNGGVS